MTFGMWVLPENDKDKAKIQSLGFSLLLGGSTLVWFNPFFLLNFPPAIQFTFTTTISSFPSFQDRDVVFLKYTQSQIKKGGQNKWHQVKYQTGSKGVMLCVI